MRTGPAERTEVSQRPYVSRILRRSTGTSAGGATPGNRSGARIADACLDTLLAALAVWTVLYHVCLILRIPAGIPALVEVLALPLCVWWGMRSARAGFEEDRPAAAGPHRWHGLRLRQRGFVPEWLSERALRARPLSFGVSLVAGAQAALFFALNAGPWWVTWVLWLCATLTALAGALASKPRTGEQAEATARPTARAPGTWVAFAWAGVLGVFSLFLNRADGDDSYYVNLAIWVAKHGTFPLRDTVMSDGALPAPYWPPVGAYDALMGTLSRFSSVQVPNLTYFLVPPLATALAVLALWRLLRSWRIPGMAVALSFPLLFLLWGGSLNMELGNLFLGRIWQDKTLLLWLVLPQLLYHFQRFAQRPAPQRLVPLFVCGVAAIGFSTNAMTLVPLVAVAGALTVLRRGTVRSALWGFAAAAGYPVLAALVTLGIGGYIPDTGTAQGAHIDSPWLVHSVLGDGLRGGLAFGCVLVGAWFIRPRVAKLLVAVGATLALVIFAPGVPAFVFGLTGLGQNLHRMVWTLPVAALLGAVAGQATTLRAHLIARLGLPAVVATAVVLTGVPLWSPANRTARMTAAPEWKLTSNTWATTRKIAERTGPADTVLLPRDEGFTTATIDRPIHLVLARELFTSPYDVPGFHAPQRLLLKHFANDELPHDQYGEVRTALRVVGVDVVCVDRSHTAGLRLLAAEGYRPDFTAATLRCVRR